MLPDSHTDRAAMSGDITKPSPSQARKLGNGRQSPTSPLKLFGQAKRKINDIFGEISKYVEESNNFFKDLTDVESVVEAAQKETTASYVSKVSGIREIINRDRMKVAFFGRTSNGKSTVINAMLKSKILPSGIGHTTNCFLQVEGADSQEAYMLVGDNAAQQNIHSVRQLASALSDFKLDTDSLIRICWPKEKCNLLRDDVVLVDSPGIDVSPDIDSWIDNFCLDADVFVLVLNAESTLMQTEKNFFHKVSSRLSKPNVFILNNRWDASASEPEMMEEVKRQHMQRTVEFLVDELGVVKAAECEERVFFVSAKEALVSRCNEVSGTPTPTEQMIEGFQGRLFEFSNFERKFEECISQSAVQTKFLQHTDNGKSIISELRQIMGDVTNAATNERNLKLDGCAETQHRLDFTVEQLGLIETEMKEKIRQMTEDVESKVSSALVDEIRRLALLVDEFDRPFHPDPLVLNLYKKELHDYVETELGQNLQKRCSTALKTQVESIEQSIAERVISLLPEEDKQQATSLLPSHNFEVAYRLDCRNLCSDFQEDIRFRFSLGITSLMDRFLGPRGRKAMLAGYPSTIERPIPSTPQTPSNEAADMGGEREMLLSLLTHFSSLYSRSTVGALAVVGVLAKAAGWRVIAVCGAIYGVVYVYERLTWTHKARERTFKKQYVDYATSKLKLIVDLTSANCSCQVQQELTSTLSRLIRNVDKTRDELVSELDHLQITINKLDEVATRSNFLKNKAVYLDSELNSFMLQYLANTSKI